MSYTESKKKLDAIRQKYGCKGEVLFRTSIQYIIDHGRELFNESDWFEFQIEAIDKRHDKAEVENKILFVSRDFEKAIMECAKELAQFGAYDLLMYIQREVWLGNGEIGEPDYQRAIGLLKRCIECIDEHHEECHEVLEELQYIGFEDDEIEYFGYGYLFDEEDEED